MLALRQIYKAVDSIFDTMTLISQDADDLTHDEFVTLLTELKAVQDMVVVRSEKPVIVHSEKPVIVRTEKSAIVRSENRSIPQAQGYDAHGA